MSINSSGIRFPATRRWISDMITRTQQARQAVGSCFGISQPLEPDTFSHAERNYSQGAAEPETVLTDAKDLLELFNLFLVFSVNSQQTEKRGKAIAKAYSSNVNLLGQIDKALENDNITSAKAKRLQRKVEKRIDQQAKKLRLNLNEIQGLHDENQHVGEQIESHLGFLL